MKNYDELTHDLLERRDRYAEEQKKKRKRVMGVATSMCCICLAVLAGFGVRQGGMFHTAPHGQTSEDALYPGIKDNFDESKSESPDDPAAEFPASLAPVIISDNPEQKGAEQSQVSGFAYFMWNSLSISGPLKNALETNPNCSFKVLATYRPTTADIASFDYEGKTLSEWAIAAYEENATEETIKGYKLAYNAYLGTVIPNIVSQLSNKNIQCSRAEYMTNGIIVIVTEEQLKNLPLGDLGHWTFDLASDDMKGSSNVEIDETELQVVN